MLVTSSASPGTNWITLGGRPASIRMLYTVQFEAIADGDGFQTTTFPIRAGAQGRFPPMAVKLKGLTAYTKPSRGRYSTRLWYVSPMTQYSQGAFETDFQTPGELCTGCCAYISCAYCTLNLAQSVRQSGLSVFMLPLTERSHRARPRHQSRPATRSFPVQAWL